MHFAPPSSLPRAAVGYSPASHFALSPRLIDRSRRKLCIPYTDNVALHSPHSPTDTAAINQYLLLAKPTAANLQQRLCGRHPMLGQTDGRCSVTQTLLYILCGQWQ